MMILRTAKGSGKQFWGCSRFPKCNGTRFDNTYAKKTIEKIAIPTDVIGTPQQEAIWKAHGINEHIIINALAGSGKTFTIVNFLRYINGKIIFVAFNRHIVDELLTRVPDGVEVKTMNSFGYANVRNWNPRVKFNEDKLWDILKLLIHQDEDNTDFLTESVAKLVNLAKYNLLDGKDHNALDMLTLKHGIELNDSRDQVYSYVESAIKMCKDRKNEVDFTDQLWFCYAHKIAITQYDYMLGDEIQDWNPLQQYVSMEAIARGGKFVGVGDEFQAIYAFSGADTQSIANMTVMLENTNRGVKIFPLTYTRRCPVSHVNAAKNIVPTLEAMPNAIDGTLDRINRAKMIESVQIGDMIIARRNAPLISVAYELIRKGVSVIVRGRDIGKGLQSLISKFKADSIDDLIDRAEQYREKEIAKLQKKGKKAESAIQSLNDKIDTLIAFTDGKNTIDEVRRSIETLFSDNNPKNSVILSSVHRAKGLEADRVFVLEYARIRIPMQDEEFAQQEANLEYISLTRSKDYLALVD